jgi:phenazine biosynthesis protein phzE
VGFYSTFAANTGADVLDTPFGEVRVSRDVETGDVHAMRGPRFAGVQFHPESVLSQHGIGLLTTLVKGTLLN